ncbi:MULTISPECIES: helix-turn-helix domain-containing protein [Bacillales]|uniref:Helix-turn-helix family protein n=1 Tax=Anoxybacteroides amylolyticum TaxID=294699 RepID=A0A160F0Y4_9BACL|nr:MULTISPECIES: helix-turn-helix transcriptional regulator [Bacillaceae]ANB59739.1 helix-turn-helix family protein [Anoxybacillus amylolyticus]
MPDNYLGNRIKELRKQLGMSQQALADAIGVSKPMISLYENNRNKPDIDTLIKIGKVLNTSLDSLLFQPADPILKKAKISTGNYIDYVHEVVKNAVTNNKPNTQNFEPSEQSGVSDFLTYIKETLGRNFFTEFQKSDDSLKRAFIRDVKLLWNLTVARDQESKATNSES